MKTESELRAQAIKEYEDLQRFIRKCKITFVVLLVIFIIAEGYIFSVIARCGNRWC